MKTKEEIELLAAKEYWNSNIESRSFIKGYTQCQEDMSEMKYTKDDIDEMALDYIINTGGLPQTIEEWKNALWKFYEQLNKTGS